MKNEETEILASIITRVHTIRRNNNTHPPHTARIENGAIDVRWMFEEQQATQRKTNKQNHRKQIDDFVFLHKGK